MAVKVIKWWDIVLPVVFVAVLAIATCSPAFGQTVAPVDTMANTLMDLPMHPARMGGPALYEYYDWGEEDDGEDPRDTPPPVFFGEEMDTESDSIVYVLDFSGSMHGPRAAAVKRESARSIRALAENMKFNVYTFTCASRRVFQTLEEAIPANKEKAIAWVDGKRAGGSTGTGPAVARALVSHPNNDLVVLLTDGWPGCAGTRGAKRGVITYEYLPPLEHRLMIKQANTQGATVNVFGIQVFDQMRGWCQAVASDNGGVYTDVP